MMDSNSVNEIQENELNTINKNAKRERKLVRSLSDRYSYDNYWSGYATVSGFSENFEEYLELSARLPENQELNSYDLDKTWSSEDNDYIEYLNISHSVEIGRTKSKYGGTYPICINYKFRVKDVVRTLHLLTEGKCSIEEKVISNKPKPNEETEHVVRRLSCNGRF